MTPRERAELDRLLTAPKKWELNAGPQTQAANSEAFEILYGGEAGGGKSELLTYLARHRHKSSLLVRRSFAQLEDTLILRSLQRYGDPRGAYNSSKHIWRFKDGCRVRFGFMEHENDVYQYQGAEFDLFAPDELTQFTKTQYLYLVSRIRTTDPKQRCRIVATSNPGGENEAWVIERWAPWLSEKHPRPAKSGEIRYFKRASDAPGDDREVETTADDPEGTSRTFIRAGLKDNPHLGADYHQRLNLLPEPYRSQLRDGDWTAGQVDDYWQVIPTAWVRAAQERWKSGQRPDVPMTAVGVDVARGGKDQTVLSPLYGYWFGEQVCIPGTETPDGLSVVSRLATMVNAETRINIDVIGVGTSVYDFAKQNNFNAFAMNGSAGTEAKDRKAQLPFVNSRAEWYWRMREALDPETGDGLALPDDPELLADLCAPTWEMKPRGIQVEAKEDIIDRLGRSPDKGDAAVYALAIKHIDSQGIFDLYAKRGKKPGSIAEPTNTKREVTSPWHRGTSGE